MTTEQQHGDDAIDEQGASIPFPLLERGDIVELKSEYEDYSGSEYTLTRGIVVEIVTRYQLPENGLEGPEVPTHPDPENQPRARVALHLFDPDTGSLYMGNPSHENPEYVDFGPRALILIRKHDEPWGSNHEIDIAEKYEKWGVTL
jgi:hypothetical protein